MRVFLLFFLSFIISVVLPIYLLRIRHKYSRFWFNILPLALGIGTAQYTVNRIWGDYYGGFYEFATYFGVFAVTMVLNVLLIHFLYRLLFREMPSLKDE